MWTFGEPAFAGNNRHSLGILYPFSIRLVEFSHEVET